MVLRMKNSELYITEDHVDFLKKTVDETDFYKYLKQKALVNRPARQVLNSWMRKYPVLQEVYKFLGPCVPIDETSEENKNQDDT